MADTPVPEVEKLPVVAYLRATKDGAPVWDEDCVCQDPVYPSDPDGSDAECVSMALVRQSDAEAEIARLRADAERLDYLQNRGATVELLPDGSWWTFRVGGLHSATSPNIRAAIDAALAAQAKGGEHG